MALQLPPLSAYVHIPWCVKKCPYCDFNSHTFDQKIPSDEYIDALIKDLSFDLNWQQGRKLKSIFFGGGTPSLIPTPSIEKILQHLEDKIGFENNIEITLEANPGTVEHGDFKQLRSAGVNRLSLGVQSFNKQHLKTLGRIHSDSEAISAISQAREAFDNFNIDLMHGLPNQTLDEALQDLETAFSLSPTHLSWYQLTIEQNTEFFAKPPSLPQEDTLYDIHVEGMKAMESAGYHQYEVSAFAKANKESKHNLNYWEFGDYLAIGAGAHGKITLPSEQRIVRYNKTRLPKDYLSRDASRTAKIEDIQPENLPLEFMMNALRLNSGFEKAKFEARTGLPFSSLEPQLETLKTKGLLESASSRIRPSPIGRNFLNSVLEQFS